MLKRYLVSYVTTGRDLLRMGRPRKPRSAATIVAPPDYGPGSRFSKLFGAMEESKEVANVFPQSKLLTGKAASKEALSRLAGPTILHVATHGFYDQAGVGMGSRGSGSGSSSQQAVMRARGMFIESLESALSSPQGDFGNSADLEAIDLSGLALAGANAGASGIITAREIAGLDWWGTQLVVLSACQTGVGAVASGEGVYGLRRALVLAGAASQVVSLWAVNDQSTRVLMKAFYAELARGTGRAEALRRAKLTLLQQPAFADPYYWAPFIAAGDWRPLDSSVFSQSQGAH